MSETVDAPKRKRRSKLEILADKAITARRKALKLRKVKLQPMEVDIMECTITIGDNVSVCNDVPSLILYLDTELLKADMLTESVRTKRFNAAEYQKLKNIQVECITSVSQETDPVIEDVKEKLPGTLGVPKDVMDPK
jgi:hypothetical protein